MRSGLNERKRGGLHGDRALGARHAFGFGLGSDVDHVRLSGSVKMRERLR
jgi:hypothetical protein